MRQLALNPVWTLLFIAYGAWAVADSSGTTSLPASNPTTAAAVLPARQSFHIYLLMGQSNMAGRGAIGPAPQETNPHILALNSDGQWVIAKDPLHAKEGRIEPGIGPGMSFAREMLKANPNVTIGLVPCAVGGTPLRRWVKRGDLYDKAVARAKVAARSGAISGVLWHQGESDSDKKAYAESYEARLTQMFKDLRRELDQPDLPIVVGQLGTFVSTDKHPYVDTVRQALQRVPTVLPHVGYADSTGLNHKGDELHFTADAQRELGARYAKAMQALTTVGPQTAPATRSTSIVEFGAVAE
jgi:hypothetical protein